jgi:putative endonuclease
MSSNAERRISDHNNGYNKTTKPYKPFKTILIEEYPTRTLARQREKYLKSGVGKEYLKSIIRSN